jgi:hypothetical protein
MSFYTYQKRNFAGCWWLTPVILATQEEEIKRIAVRSQPWGNSSEALSQKKPFTKKKKKKKKGLVVEWLKVKTLSSSPSIKKKKKRARDVLAKYSRNGISYYAYSF